MIAIDLSDSKILITGALGGIGLHVIDKLVEAGAFLLLTDIVGHDQGIELLDQRGVPRERYQYRMLDVTKPEQVDQNVDDVFDEHPNLATVLGHAGGTDLQPFAETDTDTFNRVVLLNFLSQTYLARAVLRHWTQRQTAGHLIFTSSWVGSVPWAGIAAYNASKAALNMFARTMALEYAEQGVRFNMIAPGIVNVGKAREVYDTTPTYREIADRISPLGRLGDPEALANAYAYLCSDLARDLDGHILNIDACLSLTKLA